ncbi:MAG: glycosyltransferase family 2 protein [Candidatus Hydrogenedentes bacterium]|nr:glycosyltransferase family 2 protein [Candidatus Hydrogenedentota bacterium]
MSSDTMILLPAFNEEANVARVVGRVKDAVPEATVVVVDDGSRDKTGERALDAGATVLTLPYNLGYGVALQTGYKYALRMGHSYLVQLDADGQHDPQCIPRLLDYVRGGGSNLCIGSRFLEGGTYAVPFARRAGMYVFRRVASVLLGQTITDPTSGFQAMDRRVIALYCHDSYPVDYPDVDVIVMLHRHGIRIAELPVTMFPGGGKSMHAGLRPVYYLFRMGLDIPLNLIRRGDGT